VTRWNPRALADNCGFCAISYALERSYALEPEKETFKNADQLYEFTLERLGIERHGNVDPVPRALLFPVKGDHGRMNLPVGYEALNGGAIGPNDYTVVSVAEHAGLKLEPGARDILNAFLKFAAQSRPPLKLDAFVKARMNIPALAGKASFLSMKVHMEKELMGNSIVGSTDRKHFVNLNVGPTGTTTIFDAQIGSEYDGSRVLATLREIALFERVYPRPNGTES
jgi:hypothetical protein